jgi:hypothetical protein
MGVLTEGSDRKKTLKTPEKHEAVKYLVDAFPDQERVSAGCIADGGLAQKTWFFGYRSF